MNKFIERYGISRFEAAICYILRKLLGSKSLPKFIRKMSLKKYGEKDNLARYWFARFRKCHVGKYSYGYRDITNDNLREIGAFCSIGAQVRIASTEHRLEWVSTSPITCNHDFGFLEKDYAGDNNQIEDRNVYIGNDVWIGDGVLIFDGVTIGDGAVIGARSIIRKNVPPYAIVVGVDKIVRYRFSDDVVKKLLNIKWWNWDDAKIRENIKIYRNVDEFVEKFYVK